MSSKHDIVDLEAAVQANTLEVSLSEVLAKCTVRMQDKEVRHHYHCLKCQSDFQHSTFALDHICIDEHGQLTCRSLCSNGVHLSQYARQELQMRALGETAEYLCDVCGASFTSRNRISNHKSFVHRVVVCKVCGFSAVGKAAYYAHMKEEHPLAVKPKARTFRCEDCGKVYARQMHLRQHRVVNHHVGSNDRHTHTCSFCGKCFRLKKLLMQHERIHSEVRLFPCSYCHLSFKRADSRKNHEYRHTGEKPYKCDQCGAAFIQMTSLNLHLRKHQKK